MPKAKKGNKKPAQQGDSDDDVIDPIKAANEANEVEDSQPAPTASKSKKKKDKKKGKAAAYDSDEDDVIDPIKAAMEAQTDEAPAAAKPKKTKKKAKAAVSDSDDDDVTNSIKEAVEAQADEAPAAAKPKKNKKKKAKAVSRNDDTDEDEMIANKMAALAVDSEEEKPAKRSTGKTAQSMFSMLGEDSDEKSEGDEDRARSPSPPPKESKPKKPKKKKEPVVVEENEDMLGGEVMENEIIFDLPDHSGDEGEGGGKKKKKKKDKKKKVQAAEKTEGDDLDALLASIEDGGTDPKPGKAIKGKQKQAKQAKSQPVKEVETREDKSEAAAETGLNDEARPDTGLKSAGDEDSSKTIKEKKKKMTAAEKKATKEKEEAKEKETAKEKRTAKEKETAMEKETAKEKEAADSNEEEDSDVEEKEKEKKKKKPRRGIAGLKEALQQQKEETERLRKEHEEKEKREIRAEKQRIQLIKQREEEKKRKEQEQRDEVERLKKAGLYMSRKQIEKRDRMLAQLAASGLVLPEKPQPVDEEQSQSKRSVARKYAKNKKQISRKTEPAPEPEPVKVEEKVESEPEVEEEKDTWEADSDEGVKDTWDADSEEEPEPETESKPVEKESTKSLVEPSKAAAPTQAIESSGTESEEETSSEEEESSEEESSSDDEMTPRERALARINKRQSDAEADRDLDVLRAPVVCVLGHVDTGKTKILDKLRKTNVQDGEAGGITQQIGATNVPREAIEKQTHFVKDFDLENMKVPGLLIIDTPGHESFSNLRSRGQSLCDIAILVVDIMHGLEPQTLESIELLRKGKTPFLVALNKIDRLYGWKANPHQDVQQTIKKQTTNTKQEFDERCQSVITQLAEQSLNAALYYDNPNPREYISLVPTSAHSGDGMGNLIALLCAFSQKYLAKRVSVCANLQATVMEVKALPGLGTTVDIILVNGKLKRDDVVVLPGTEGPIVTHIRDLLLPEPMRELRVKSNYRHVPVIETAQGVKIVGRDLDKVMAGLPMYVAKYKDEVEIYKEWITIALRNVLSSIKLSPVGVFVQASTLGSLEALLEYLRTVKVPYAGINIGPVHKKDVMKASVMVEHHEQQYASILAFDVKVDRDAQELAEASDVKIFTADIIYHLFDAFNAYQEEILERGRRENNHLKIFPCKLRVLPQFIFNARDPIVMGVSIDAGFLTTGTPLCVPTKEFVQLGVCTSIERESKPIEKATRGMEVAIKIENLPGQAPRMYGRHFDESDLLVSKISRDSIDAVKKYFKKDMTKEDWKLVIELKNVFEII